MPKRRTPVLAALALAVLALPACAGGSPAPETPGPRAGSSGASAEGPQEYTSVIPADAETRSGLWATHRVGDDLFFELPAGLFGREIFMLSRRHYDSRTDNYFFGPQAVVYWEREGNTVRLRQRDYDITADRDDRIYSAVRDMQEGPVVAAFEVETFGADSSAVIEVTDLFLSSNPDFGTIEGVQRDRSSIQHFTATSTTMGFDILQTGMSRAQGASSPSAQTAKIHWSFKVMPDEPMMPRLRDTRVGFISFDIIDYGRESDHQSVEREYLRRFRLEPTDPSAYARGELVDPVEQIVYWIDPATPEWLIPWVEAGVEDWDEAFEEAGYRDAIDGRLAPSPEEDPDFSMYSADHSVIYWRPSPIPNANGGARFDPRSGEIFKGEVNMYHNVQALLRNWYFIQAAPLDPRAQSLPMPDSLMGRLVQYVVAHEIGHSIGLPHNMKASAQYPLDSLRSESFLRRMGHVSTLMDYSRINYVVQPEDSIPVELLLPDIGPWDRYAIKWGYSHIPGAETPDEEWETLDSWSRMQDTIPYLRWSTPDSPNDPEVITEAVGDADAVEASKLAIRNLERVMDLLVPVAERPGQDYELMDELYGEAVDQYEEYMEHVTALVGGAFTQEKYGTGTRFTPVPRARQEEAMQFFEEYLFTTPEMFVDPAILRRIEPEGVLYRLRGLQSDVIGELVDQSRVDRLIEYEALGEGDGNPYTAVDLFDDLHESVWGEVDDRSVTIDVWRRNLQRAYLEAFDEELNPDEEAANPNPFFNPGPPRPESDHRALLRGELVDLRAEIDNAIGRAGDRMTRTHLRDIRMEIDRILDSGE